MLKRELSGFYLSSPSYLSMKKWSVSSWVMSNTETPWAVACQASLFMKFSRQEFWCGLPFPPPGDIPDPGIEPPQISYIAGRFFTVWGTTEAYELQQILSSEYQLFYLRDGDNDSTDFKLPVWEQSTRMHTEHLECTGPRSTRAVTLGSPFRLCLPCVPCLRYL